jgi:hypothetical protein
MKNVRAWRGLAALISDAVANGTSAVERIHRETASRAFELIEHVAPNAQAVRAIAGAYSAAVAGVYGSVRAVNHALALGVDGVLRALEPDQEAGEPSAAPREPGEGPA